MKKLMKILLWVLGILVALVLVLILAGPTIFGWLTSPDHEFGDKPIPEAPDYSLRSNWSGWPDDSNPAERLPTGVTSPPQSERLADAFFLHPTTYGGKEHWVQPMDYERSRQGTDYGTTSIQASAFNECCRVYAPRYRQANLGAYRRDDARAIMEIGYEDVKRAFHHFVDTIDPDSPIVLGSHSQGSFQMMRLVMEEIDGTPLMDRVVAIYAIGHKLPQALVDQGYKDIEVCNAPTQTGCFISWDAHRGDRRPSHWSNKEEQFLWNGTDYSGFAPSQSICVNPITWRTDSEPSSKQQHLGALPRWKRSATLDGPLGELIVGSVSAHCEQGEFSNWLFVNPDLDPRLKADGLFGYFERNLHGSDYSLFWANIRQNAVDRTRAWYAAREDSPKPNVVVILADDVGYCDTEMYGCDTVPTPNIKQLAGEGALFTAGYVTSPVCSPSRASLMTGRYQHRFGHEFLPEADPDGNGGLPVAEITLADAMRDAGYVTGMVGKWHLGAKEEFHPLNRGFDEFYGMVTWGADYADPTRDDMRVWTHPLAPPRDPDEAWAGRGADTVMRGKEPIDEDQYLTEAFTREAVAFIEASRDRPFFLYVPYTAIHGPLQVTQKYYDRFAHVEDESKRIYQAMTSALDDGIGELLDAIAGSGLEENTIVVFMSDNGAGVADYTNNAPLRLGKHTLFEGGIRVPFSMKWPARIAVGSVFDEPVSALDIFPTVIAAAGGELPGDRPIDGVDLLPFVTGSDSESPHATLFWRQGPNWAVRQGEWKLIHAADRNWLYNLSDDIGEQTNVAEQHPDVVDSLTGRFREWNSANIDPLWPPVGAKSLPDFSIDGVAINWVL